jgi:6,7-dimethyl-8-ribityllumazine synthase
MPKINEGNLSGKGLKIGIIQSKFNHFITDKLLEGALDGLKKCGVDDADITVYKVPGAFEVPLIAKQLAGQGNFNAIIALGALIRGETPHFDYLASVVTKGLSSAAMKSGVPIVFGILTTDDVPQAIDRAGVKEGNKGYEAALTAVELSTLLRARK